MNNSYFSLLLTMLGSLVLSVSAQDTNSLKTDLGVFEAQTGTVLVKGFGHIGSLTVGTDRITVSCKESTDITTGRKIDGLAILIQGNTSLRKRILVDYEEIDPLLEGINYLNKISYEITPLPGFEACFATKAGLMVVANSQRRQGLIQDSLEYGDDIRILLTPDQMTQFYRLLEQAKKSLDNLRNPK